ncbi:MAG: hypothetical protein GY720_20140 [bacterium]|nr:hypothetical protein [bacterium]
MIRRYTPEPVDAAALDRIIDAGLRAPSAGFAQGVEFVVLTSDESRSALAIAANETKFIERGFEPWLSVAPVHIVVAVDPDVYHHRYAQHDKTSSSTPSEWSAPYWSVDAGAALMLLLMATTNEGLAAGFLGTHAFENLGGIVGIPARFETIGLVTIGHGDPSPVVGSARRVRRPRSETVHRDRWNAGRRISPGS